MGIAPDIFLKPMEPSIVKTVDRIVTLTTAASAGGGR